MSSSRLARYFKGSRDNWKNKALEKQKKLRLFEQKIRDLEKSRKQWKSQAKKAEKKVKELEKEREKSEQADEECQKTELIKIKGHHYTIETIQTSIQQVIKGRNSYRSVATTMELLSENFEVASPHFSSIRKWIERVGLYELSRPKEKRNDWIFLVDITLELGQKKSPDYLWTFSGKISRSHCDGTFPIHLYYNSPEVLPVLGFGCIGQ